LWKKRLMLALSSSLVLIVAGGAMLTVSTAVTYGGSCATLTGFPGLLQRAGFVVTGPCKTKIGGTVCGAGTVCTPVDGATNSGKCHNVAAVGQPANCQCVANTTSSGLK
jgi:hypothetical protein